MTDNDIVKDLESVIGWFTNHGSNTNTAVIDISRRAIDVIERQKAEIEQWKEEANKYQSLWASACNDAKSDVVEVVRCKNCIHSTESPMWIICQKFWRDVNEDGYCSYGERKEE